MTMCTKCERGPLGIEGHQDLYVQTRTIGGSQVHFRCMVCDHIWVRRYTGEGAFVWAAGELPATELPR